MKPHLRPCLAGRAQLHLLFSAGIDICLLCHFPSGDMRTNTARTLLAPASLDQEPLPPLTESVGLSEGLWGKLTNTVVTGLIRSTIKGRPRGDPASPSPAPPRPRHRSSGTDGDQAGVSTAAPRAAAGRTDRRWEGAPAGRGAAGREGKEAGARPDSERLRPGAVRPA
uniref:Uncharacterized protein n=1 Tax=Rangifer tarandus platyrhynchus TaxID=3082113 RepID=A0ACB0FM88_RANTA|nr:unnamed protein product [Rangifer tarandus platyrhynchus]